MERAYAILLCFVVLTPREPSLFVGHLSTDRKADIVDDNRI
jgi:hypothetical protein